MKLELKKISHSESLSEETNAFTADFYVDGKKTAHCRNDGRGGSTFINHYDNMSETLKSAKSYCKLLPPVVYDDFTLEMDIELYIDNMLQKHLENKELKKNFRKGLVYNENGLIKIIAWKGWTIPKLMLSEKGKEAVMQTVKDLTNKGFVVLNTNI
jgi:hypothetical protein